MMTIMMMMMMMMMMIVIYGYLFIIPSFKRKQVNKHITLNTSIVKTII